MRLLVWTLLVALIAILSSCDAASLNADKPLQRKLYNKVASHGVAAQTDYKHGGRMLRGESNKIAPIETETEERAIPGSGIAQKIKAFFRTIKDKYLAWEQKRLTPGFKEMAENKITYDMVREDFRVRLNWSGLWGTPSGFKRYAKLYNTWLKNNGYTKLANPNV